MKNVQFILIALFSVFIMASCGSRQEGEKAEAGDALAADSLAQAGSEYQVIPDQSNLEWYGKKPTGEHNGTVKISTGSIKAGDNGITGGKFTIDMNSITVLDLTDANMNQKLTGHLKSEDFFNSAKFPTAEFEITSVQLLAEAAADGTTHSITGNLKIKDIVKSITFKAAVSITANEITANAPLFYIDRAEWDIRYKSKKFFDQLKDDFINDEIGLKISLKASK